MCLQRYLFFDIVLTMKVDINSLAELSKIELTEEELKELSGEFDSILDFVSKVQSLDLDLEPKAELIHNVMREDSADFDYDFDKEALLTQAKRNDGKYILVKKVIKH